MPNLKNKNKARQSKILNLVETRDIIIESTHAFILVHIKNIFIGFYQFSYVNLISTVLSNRLR